MEPRWKVVLSVLAKDLFYACRAKEIRPLGKGDSG